MSESYFQQVYKKYNNFCIQSISDAEKCEIGKQLGQNYATGSLNARNLDMSPNSNKPNKGGLMALVGNVAYNDEVYNKRVYDEMVKLWFEIEKAKK